MSNAKTTQFTELKKSTNFTFFNSNISKTVKFMQVKSTSLLLQSGFKITTTDNSYIDGKFKYDKNKMYF